MITSKAVGSGYVTARFTSNGYVTLNHATGTIGANNHPSEVVQTMNIVSVVYSLDVGTEVTIQRGANTILSLFGSGNMDLVQSRVDGVGGEPVSNTVVTFSGTGGGGSVVMKFSKVSDMPSQY